jgi:hypothetical protein
MTWILLAAYMGHSYYFGQHETPQQCRAQIAVHKSACPACRIEWRCESQEVQQ